MAFGKSGPTVQVTPPPPQKETTDEIVAREKERQKSLVRAFQATNKLGANQLRGDSVGLNLGSPYNPN